MHCLYPYRIVVSRQTQQFTRKAVQCAYKTLSPTSTCHNSLRIRNTNVRTEHLCRSKITTVVAPLIQWIFCVLNFLLPAPFKLTMMDSGTRLETTDLLYNLRVNVATHTGIWAFQIQESDFRYVYTMLSVEFPQLLNRMSSNPWLVVNVYNILCAM